MTFWSSTCLSNWASEPEYRITVHYQVLKEPILSPKPDLIGWLSHLSWGCQHIQKILLSPWTELLVENFWEVVGIMVSSVGGKEEGKEQLGPKGAVNSLDTTWVCLSLRRFWSTPSVYLFVFQSSL